MYPLQINRALIGLILLTLALGSACRIPIPDSVKTLQPTAAPPISPQTDKPDVPKEPKEDVPSDDPVVNMLGDKITGLVKKCDYQALEALGRDLTQGKERFKGGGWKIHMFDNDVARPVPGSDVDTAWETHLQCLQNWAAAMPKSIYARTGLINAYVEYAWVARGDGYADTIKPESVPIYSGRLEKASAVADEASQLEARYTGYFDALLLLGTVQCWDHARFEQVFNDAIRFEPKYQYFYTQKAVYLLPRWSGEPGEWENFADQVKADLGEKDGPKMYFIIVAEIRGYFGRDLFRANRISWEDTKKGFAIWEKDYGASRYRLNEFAQLANHANDAQTSCTVFGRLQGPNDFEPDIWDSRRKFEAYRKMAGEMCKVAKFNNQAE